MVNSLLGDIRILIVLQSTDRQDKITINVPLSLIDDVGVIKYGKKLYTYQQFENGKALYEETRMIDLTHKRGEQHD